MIFSNCHRLSSLLLLFLSWNFVLAQRKKEGCFDAAPLSCDTPRANPLDLDFDLAEVCLQLESEIFPTTEVAFDTTLHKEYLNSIEASSELCERIQIAYSQCLFCADTDFQQECFDNAVVISCGGGLVPTRGELLLNHQDEAHARFHTGQDIDLTCQELEAASQRPFPFNFPTTQELCERQNLAKHLCPGVCDGTCFDPDLPLPSCDPNAYKGPVNQSLDLFATCDEIRYTAFYDAPIDIVLNVSVHPDYLRAIPDDNNSSTFCQDARQAYSHCSWCAPELCFNPEEHPATCQAPKEATNYSDVDVNAVCHDIYWAFYDMTFPDDVFNISLHTGRILMPENTTICDQSRQVYHECYWCAPDVPLDFCLEGTVCSSNVAIPEDFVSAHLQNISNMTTDAIELYCDQIYDNWNTTEASHYPFAMQTCYEHIYLARLCPQQFCPEAEAAQPLDQSYLGATTTAQKTALIWASRVSAFLTFFGASYILYDIFTDAKARQTVYHSLLIGMTIFDLVTAAAWSFATAPIPKDEASHVLGAMGTQATCTAQGFFIQLGFTSVFYNVSLALYYVLVIACDWRESQLKRYQFYLHAFPLTLGTGLALGALPIYHWIEYGCHILPPPEGEFWTVLVFVVLPLGLSIIAITESMLVVFCKVRARTSASKKWSLGVGKAGKLEQAVFWQCLFYTLAFYLTWPIMFSVYLASVDVNGPFALTLTVAFVAPLQGFTNWLVYMRPKLFKMKSAKNESHSRESIWRKAFRGRKAQTIQESTTSQASETGRVMDPSAALALQRNAAASASHLRPPSRTLREVVEEDTPSNEMQVSFHNEDMYVPDYAESSSDLDFVGTQEAVENRRKTQLPPEPGSEHDTISDCRVLASDAVEPMADLWSEEGAPSMSLDTLDALPPAAHGDVTQKDGPEQDEAEPNPWFEEKEEAYTPKPTTDRESDTIDLALFFEEPSERSLEDLSYDLAYSPPQNNDPAAPDNSPTITYPLFSRQEENRENWGTYLIHKEESD